MRNYFVLASWLATNILKGVMLNLSKVSIKQKLIGYTMIISTVSLLLACTVFIVYDYTTQRNRISDGLLVLVDTIGTHSTVSLNFEDPQSAFETLSALKLERHILAAAIYNSENNLFVSYKHEEFKNIRIPEKPRNDGEYTNESKLTLFHPINSDDKRIGTIYVQYDLTEFRTTLYRYTLIVLAILFVSSLLAFFLSSKLQNMISKPILDLARTAEKISSDQDYSVRAMQHSQDEIGILINHFNEMLIQIQNRDMALQVAQKELQLRAKENFKLILNAAGEGIYGLDLEGKTTFANPAAEAMLGYGANELLGKSQHDLIHYARSDGTPYPKEECPVYATCKNGKVHHVMDEVYWRKNGSSFLVEYVSNPILENGELAGAVITFRDITQRQQQEKDLIEAKIEAENANHAKSEFLSKMSHELRTPMNAILGFGQLLMLSQKESLTDSQSNNVNRILNAGNHLLELINEILDLSRIESGSMTILIEDINLTSSVDSVLPLVQPMARELEVEIENNLDSNVCVLADLTRLKQVLLNLLTNAVKYNKPKGRVVLDCEISSDDKVRINVTDNGMGISEEKKKFLFQPFNRLGAEATEIQGTGIGLTITKHLIELMQGSITLESTVGHGSCFAVELPMAMSTGNICESQTKTPFSSIETDEKIRHTILYVEDNPQNLELVQAILSEQSNIKLISATRAQLGIDLARSHQPHLILMDINLPEMSGIEALEKLKSFDETRSIPTIAVSANAMKEDIDKAMAAGFNNYIIKPIDITVFMKVITETLNR